MRNFRSKRLNPRSSFNRSRIKKLEYRGYDSSGIAVNGEKGIWLCKSAGSLSHLEKSSINPRRRFLP